MTKSPPKKRAPKKSKAVTKPYEPTQRERESIEAYHARRKEQKPAPCMKVTSKE